jgi:hypothetical protein
MAINKHPGLAIEPRQVLIGNLLDRFLPRLPPATGMSAAAAKPDSGFQTEPGPFPV